MTDAAQRALILAYFFPPLGGGGVQRTLKFVKYLPEHGVAPIVLTTGFAWSPIRDASLVAEIPQAARVIRAPEVPLQIAKWGLHGALRRARLPTRPASYIGWPDEAAGWIPGATWHALRAVRRYRPHVIYSTSSPFSAHVVALLVNRLTGLPWVADFRDGWTRNPEGPPFGGLLGRLSAAVEREVAARAHTVVVVDDSVEVMGLDRAVGRRVVIRNGVDPDDVPAALRPPKRGRMRLSYVGTLYGELNAAPIFAALRALVDRGAIPANRIEVRLVGHHAIDDDTALAGIQVTRPGYVDHAAAVAEMSDADVLLFYTPVSNRGTSGKLYEYLATGSPILCVSGRESFAYQLVQELRAGPCAEPADQAGIEAAIAGLYRDWEADRLIADAHVRAEALRRFSRPVLAGELARVLSAAARTR